jgi:predicted dehydrogenase
MNETRTLRIGCLGAARIVPAALIRPARRVHGVEVAAIAARDRARAVEVAERRAIPTVHDSYEDLIADDSIDAVYVPLPNGLHGYWTIAALEAGRHVLCEKPFTANADEAREVQRVAERTGLVAMEAFHWRYHPLADRMAAIVASGELGGIRRIESNMCFPLPRRDDIRWSVALAGGAMMDAGCYPVSIVRFLAGAEPRVVSAKASLRSPGIDRFMEAELEFEDGRTGRIVTSLWSRHVIGFSVRVVGTRATMHVVNPFSPHVFHRLTVHTLRGHDGQGTRRREKMRGMSTYAYQLAAFRAAVLDGGPNPTSPADAAANMQVIDDVYRAAGLEPRLPTQV